MSDKKITIEQIDDGIPAPSYALAGDAGLDCYSTISTTLAPNEITRVPLGIKMQLPSGTAALVLSKSGLASRQGLVSIVGLVDSGYRGEIQMIARNDSETPIEIQRGQKVCQIMVIDVPQVSVEYGQVNDKTERGSDGFGSTGI